MSERMPKKSSNINITRLPEELLVFDLEYKEVHCLNDDAGLVFDACDGESTIDEVSSKLKADRGRDDADTYVLGALAAFESKGLLEVESKKTGRREFLARSGIGASAAALMITSVILPEPAQALSLRRRR